MSDHTLLITAVIGGLLLLGGISANLDAIRKTLDRLADRYETITNAEVEAIEQEELQRLEDEVLDSVRDEHTT